MGRRWHIPILLLAAVPLSAIDHDFARARQAIEDASRLRDSGLRDSAGKLLAGALAAPVPPDPLSRIILSNHLALILFEDGRLLESEYHYRSALAIARQVCPPGHSMPFRLSLNLASLLVATGQNSKAAALAVSALAAAPTLHSTVDGARMLAIQGEAALTRGDLVQAEALFNHALSIVASLDEPGAGESRAMLLVSLARLHHRAGRPGPAADAAERAVAALASLSGASPVARIAVLRDAARIFSSLKAPSHALSLLNRALALGRAHLGPHHALLASVLFDTAPLLRNSGRKRDASAYEKEARAIDLASRRENLTGHTVELSALRD